MFSKDIARKPFFVRTGQDVRDVRMYVRTDVRTRVMLYAPPPIINGGGIITQQHIKGCPVDIVCYFKNVLLKKTWFGGADLIIL